MPRFCRKIPVPGHHQVAAPAGGVGLGQRNTHPAASTAHRWMVPPGVSGSGRRGRRLASIARRTRAAGSTSSRAVNVGAVEQHRVAIVSRPPGGLRQQVRPRRIRRIVGKVETVGDHRSGQRQVALGRRRHRPDAVVPGSHPQRVDPVGQGSLKIVLGEQAAAELDQTCSEHAAVETLLGPRSRQPSAVGPPGVGGRDPRLVARPGVGSPARQTVATRAGRSPRPATGRRESRRRRSPPRTAGPASSGSRPNRSCNVNQPSTQAGTVADRTSPRIGIAVRPSARMAPASAPDPARPMPASATGSASPPGWTSARRSPPIPHMCWVLTASTALAPMAASAAVPPDRRRSTPAAEAR